MQHNSLKVKTQVGCFGWPEIHTAANNVDGEPWYAQLLEVLEAKHDQRLFLQGLNYATIYERT